MDLKFVYPIPCSMSAQVTKFLRSNYYLEEPICAMIGLSEIEELMEYEDKVVCEAIKDNLSVVVLHQNNEIAAVGIQNIVYKNKVKVYPNHPVYRSALEAIDTLYDMADIFNKFNVDKVIHQRVSSVKKKLQGNNITKLILEKFEIMARNAGIKILQGEATSYYLQQVIQKIGYQTILEKTYKEMELIQPSFPWKIIPPHDSIKIVVKCID